MFSQTSLSGHGYMHAHVLLCSCTGEHVWELQLTDGPNKGMSYYNPNKRMYLGVATENLPLDTRPLSMSSSSSATCWFWSDNGSLNCNNNRLKNRCGENVVQPGSRSQAKFDTGDTLRLLLDCDAGTLTCFNVTKSVEAGVLLGVLGRVFPFVCFDNVASTATIVSTGVDLEPRTTMPGKLWAKGEAVLISSTDGRRSNNRYGYAHVVSALATWPMVTVQYYSIVGSLASGFVT
eukprot:SAG31_NODE_16589_length_703_cov_0.950331_1_plen_233_part_11